MNGEQSRKTSKRRTEDHAEKPAKKRRRSLITNKQKEAAIAASNAAANTIFKGRMSQMQEEIDRLKKELSKAQPPVCKLPVCDPPDISFSSSEDESQEPLVSSLEP